MRILWISDIHYKTKYKDNEHVCDYLRSFKKFQKKYTKEKPLDYILLTGDISFSGERTEFMKFSKVLKKYFPKIPCLSVVGNHDVNWDRIIYALGEERKLSDLFDVKPKEINDSEKFREVFRDYYDFFFKKCIKSHNLCNDGKSYDSNSYSGYHFDKKNKVLFLLLNSSWYSYGPGVLEKAFIRTVQSIPTDNNKKQYAISLFKKLGGSLSQNGKQTYHLSQYKYLSEIGNLIQSYPELKVISLAHHPISWLRWEKLYGESSNTYLSIDEILDRSDILLNGHLHSPVQKPTIINDSCYNLLNGAFLDYHHIDSHANNAKKMFPNNWFVILNIKERSFSYESYKCSIAGKLVNDQTYSWKREVKSEDYYYADVRG